MFKDLEECTKWVRLHTPILIHPIRKAKTVFISPFTSGNAFDAVTKCIAEELYKKLQDGNN